MMRVMRKAVLVVVLLAGCGDDGVRHTPDATVHDGPVIDDAPIDSAAMPVAITTTLGGQPAGGVHVYFQNADSSLVLATVTDASGTASAVMQPGGYVTAITSYNPPAFVPSSDQLSTFVGVKPGDHLQLALPNVNAPITVTVTVPADQNASASLYEVYSPCSSGETDLVNSGSAASPSGTMYLYDCGATTDFLVVALDSSGNALDYIFKQNVAVADQQPVDLTANTYTAATTRTVNYDNADNLSLSYSDTLLDVAKAMYNRGGLIGAVAVSTSYPMPAFTGANDLMVTHYNGSQDLEYFVDWGPYTATFTTDLAPRMLPDFQSGPTFDVATHTMSFTEAATGATPDFVFASISAFRNTDNHDWTWRIVAPHATSLVYPTLPTDVYDYNITANDQPNSYDAMIGKVPGGYDAVRPYLLSQYGAPQPTQFAMGTAGSATVEEYAALARGTQRKAVPNRHPVLSHRRR
jgi:hypothetical protein